MNLFLTWTIRFGHFPLIARDTFEEMYHKYDYGRFFRSSSISIHFISIANRTWEDMQGGQVSKEEWKLPAFPILSGGRARDVALLRLSDDFFSVIPYKNRLMPHAYEGAEYLAGKYSLYILFQWFPRTAMS